MGIPSDQKPAVRDIYRFSWYSFKCNTLNSVRNDIKQRLAEAARRDNTFHCFASGEGLQLNLQGRMTPGCPRMRTSIQGGVARESFHSPHLRILIQSITSQFHKSWKNIRWAATLKHCPKDKGFGRLFAAYCIIRFISVSALPRMVDNQDSRHCEVRYVPSC